MDFDSQSGRSAVRRSPAEYFRQQACYSYDDHACSADHWAVHGNHRSYIDPSSRSFAYLSSDWHRPSTFGYHRYPQLDDRAADPTSRHGAVCFIQSFKCPI